MSYNTTTTIIIEHRFPSFFQFIAGCSVYTHVVMGVTLGFVLWFGITLATAKPPPVCQVSYEYSSKSLKSTSSTPVDHDTDDDGHSAKQPIQAQDEDEEDGDFVTFENPFADVAAPVKLSRTPSLALQPFARRLSMPGRPGVCTPHHFTPLHTPLRQHAIVLRHGSLSDDNDSYFPAPHIASGKFRVIEDDDDKAKTEENQTEPEKGETEAARPALESRAASTTAPLMAPTLSKHDKAMKLKRVTKKVAAFFHHTPRHQ